MDKINKIAIIFMYSLSLIKLVMLNFPYEVNKKMKHYKVELYASHKYCCTYLNFTPFTFTHFCFLITQYIVNINNYLIETEFSASSIRIM